MKIFVYGTLLRLQGNHRLLARSRLLREARTKPKFQMHSLGGFPGVVGGGSHAIVGELYDVDAATLAALDRLEGHPSFYRRTVIHLDDGERVEAYLLPRDRVAHCPVIQSGSWLEHRKERSHDYAD